MENNQCPCCKKDTPKSYDLCAHCKFPFSGSEKEKSVHIGKFISDKNIIEKSEDTIQNSKKILYYIVAANIFAMVFSVFKNQHDIFSIILTSCITVIFLICAIFLNKNPKIFTIIPLVMLLLIYTINFLFDSRTFFQGIIFKTIFVLALCYNLYTLNLANKFKKENNI